MPVDTRWFAIAKLDLYDELQGDPVVDDHGFSVYDILKKSWKHNLVNYQVNPEDGLSNLRFIKEIGLCCRPYFVPQDTLLIDYIASDTWEEQEPDFGRYRISRLVQFDGSAGVVATLSSHYTLPENPHFAVSVILSKVSELWNEEEDGVPRVRVKFGQDQWCLQLDPDGLMLMRWDPLVLDYYAVQELSAPAQGIEGSDEVIIWVLCLRGKIGVSTNMGRTFEWEEPDDPDDYIIVPESRVNVEARGGTLTFGMHQIGYITGWFASKPFDTLTARITPVSTITGRFDRPAGSVVSFSDISDHLNRMARYRIDLEPAETSHGPGGRYKFMSTPAVYAVTYSLPVTHSIPTLDFSNPWDKWILGVDINKPRRLGESTCTVTIHHDAKTLFTGNYRWRKVRIWLGYRHRDGTKEWFNAYTGYIRNVSLDWSKEFNQSVITLKIDNVSARYRRTRWTHLDVIPLGGLTPNAVGDYTLYTEGQGPFDREWSPAGAYVPLPPGLPEKPFEMIRVNEEKWKTMERCFGYFDLELGVTDDGIIFSVGQGQTGIIVEKEFSATGADDLRKQIDSVQAGIDYSESGTAVLCYGVDPSGDTVISWANDRAAETTTSSGRACPWREVVNEEQHDAVKSYLLVSRTGAIARQTFPLRYTADASTPVDLGVSRRSLVTVSGCAGVGIVDGTQYRIMDIKHAYRARETLTSLKTVAKLEIPY